YLLTSTDSSYWYKLGDKVLQDNLKLKQNNNVAKNVIFFLGDGMGVSTVTAARIYDGQLKNQSGEENFLIFEKFPNAALVKTYNVDKQVPDSAGTATAFFGGVKGNYHTLGLNGRGVYNECTAALDVNNQITTIAKWAQEAGKSTGFVTTMRVTHATPGGLYAISANRDWESDGVMPEDKRDCLDIAAQLVILGGGRKHFVPSSANGTRLGDTNLINEWIESKKEKNAEAQYVTNLRELKDVDTDKTEYLLGLFNNDHLSYEMDKSDSNEPTIIDMTEKAIKILSKNKKGFYLMVEGGKIDWAHHANNARRALLETVYLNKAVERALQLTDTENTLIVVTADHSHVFTINGYPERGHNILGVQITEKEPFPNLGYTTLMYTNGPGYRYTNDSDPLAAINVTGQKTEDPDYKQLAGFPMKYETHGGEDVAVYATGPMSHLFRGVIEQNYIPIAIGYASCVRGGDSIKCSQANTASSMLVKDSYFTVILMGSILKMFMA
uniref:Alkaline phosphatase n=1 Tax=Strigamia maritima TaxID=126957 RepID=T1J1A3_STRMM